MELRSDLHARVEYGGAAARDSIPVSRGGHYRPAGLGSSSDTIDNASRSRWPLHALAIGGVLAGGAFTGWLAAGTKRGAVIGAATHLALFGATVALLGQQFSSAERALYGVAALGSGLGVGYLLYVRKRRG